MRGLVFTALSLVLVGHAVDAAAQSTTTPPPAAAPPAAAPAGTAASASTPTSTTSGGAVRKDPKGIKGISPFWEAIKKGDDAYAARDVDGARAQYQEAIRLEPQNPMGHYRLGEAELTKGNLTEADADWQSALRFSSQNPTLRAKALFVLADLKERQRQLDLAENGWNAYADHAKANPSAKTYPGTPVDRNKRIEEWKKLENEYAAVKERIKAHLEEAEKKAAQDAMSPRNR